MMKRLDYKWTVLALVSATYFLAQGTRQIYNAVLPQVKSGFAADGVSDLQLGLVGSVFTLAFGLVVPFAGLASDFLRRKWIVVAGAFIFSLGIFLSGFATGIGLLIVAYGVMNACGQSLLPPANSSLISQFHVETRGTAFAVYQGAIYLGILVCSGIAGWFCDLSGEGWRIAFKVFGALGLVWSVALIFVMKDTPQVSAEAVGRPTIREAVKAFFGKPTALLMMAALGCYFYANYGFKTWGPSYLLRTVPGLTPGAAAFQSMLWFLIGALAGVFAAGRISDRLKTARPGVRFEVELVGFLLMIPPILVMSFTSCAPIMYAALVAFGFSTGVYDSNLYAALLDVIEPRYRAAAVGVFGCGGCILGALGPGMMGWMNERFSMRTSFASLAAFAIVGAVIVLIVRSVTLKRDLV